MNAVTVKRQGAAITSLEIWLDLFALALVAVGNAMLAARINAVPLALGLVLLALATQLIRVRSGILAVPLHLPFLLFLVSAWIGVTVSYDPALSLRKFELIVGGIALYYVLATTQTELGKRTVVWGLLAIGAGVGIFFVTQTDFAQEPVKVEALNQIGLLLNRMTPQLGQHTPHANLVAGIMLLALPYAAALAYDALRRRHIISLLVAGALGLVVAFGLLMTTSRGAWLALALLVSIGALFYLASQLAGRAGYSPGIGIAAAINLGLIVFLLGAVFARNEIIALLNTWFGNVGGVPRLQLYSQVAQLSSDYAFTGAGLDTFSPHYSTYELLISVPFLPHGHNLFLQIWFEQGILGLIALLWLLAAYYLWVLRRRGRMNWLGAASAAAFTMLLLHGLVDQVFYFSRVISLMFIPIGLTVCALQPFVPLASNETHGLRRRWLAGAVAGGILFILILGILFARRTQLMGAWAANLGALKQAQIELPLIDFPVPTPSQVRRNSDLSLAEQMFVTALQSDPNNRTAHTRLGLIELDRADFPSALGHLQAAYSADKSNRAVVKALGFAYLWMGQSDQALPLLKQIPEARPELEYAAFDWRQRDRDDLAAYAVDMLQQLK